MKKDILNKNVGRVLKIVLFIIIVDSYLLAKDYNNYINYVIRILFILSPFIYDFFCLRLKCIKKNDVSIFSIIPLITICYYMGINGITLFRIILLVISICLAIPDIECRKTLD